MKEQNNIRFGEFPYSIRKVKITKNKTHDTKYIYIPQAFLDIIKSKYVIIYLLKDAETNEYIITIKALKVKQ
jgi:hypothetical protein